jgi:hypothetical protein
MILSYSLDVRHIPLHILFFLILCHHTVFKFYHLAEKFITFDKNPVRVNKVQYESKIKKCAIFPKVGMCLG